MILPGSTLAERLISFARLATVQLMEDASTLGAVQRLRYSCYKREGIIRESADGLLIDEFDYISNKYNFVVSVDGQLVSAIRVHVLTANDDVSPTQHAFPEVISRLLADGALVVDPNRFVVDRDASTRWPELPYFTLRLPYLVATVLDADIALAAVRQEHIAFYTRILAYSLVGAPRPYPKLTKPLALMTADFKASDTSVLARFPFFGPTAAEMSWLRKSIDARPQLRNSMFRVSYHA
ncbi:hypothetical protein Q3C01_01385 [Bradyrhizobium sp. UFLA05-109]